MRRSELRGLCWADVNLDEAWVSVTETKVVVRGHAQDSDGKSERRHRLTLDSTTTDALRKLRACQTDDRIFTWEDGRPIYPDVIQQ